MFTCSRCKTKNIPSASRRQHLRIVHKIRGRPGHPITDSALRMYFYETEKPKVERVLRALQKALSSLSDLPREDVRRIQVLNGANPKLEVLYVTTLTGAKARHYKLEWEDSSPVDFKDDVPV